MKSVIVKERIPGALVKPCPKPYSKPINVTGDFVARGNHNAAALAECAAQVDGVREWDARP